jgi:hypothetical protein
VIIPRLTSTEFQVPVNILSEENASNSKSNLGFEGGEGPFLKPATGNLRLETGSNNHLRQLPGVNNHHSQNKSSQKDQ